MGEKTHWKKLDNPDYLGAYAFQPGQEMVLEIAKVGQETVFNPTTGKKEDCTVARFTDNKVKPMILNVTNCKQIAKLYGTPYIEDWNGCRITVYIAKVKAFGEEVDALRIKKKIPTLEKFYCEHCGCEIVGVSGKSAKEMVDIGMRNCGKALCLKCMKEEKEFMDRREEKEDE